MNALSESDLIAELGWLNRLARSLVRDPATADDLAQDTVEAALANPPGNLGSGIRPWLATVARNLAATRRRAAGRRLRREERVNIAAPETPVDAAKRTELFSGLAQAVVELPDPYRETVLLCFYEGRSTRQVAKQLGISVEALRTRRKRAVAMLRGRMTKRHGAGALLALVPEVGATVSVSVSALLASKAGWLLPAAAALLLGVTGWVMFKTDSAAAASDRERHATVPATAPASESDQAGALAAAQPAGILAGAQLRAPLAVAATTGVQVLLVREPSGEAVAGATVAARFTPEGGEATSLEAVTDTDGSCWLALPAGVEILLQSRRLGLIPQAVFGGGGYPEALTLENGEARAVTLTSPKPATVTGSVVDEAGLPVVGAEISAFENGRDPGFAAPPALTVATDSAGCFRFEGLLGETTLVASQGERRGDQWLVGDLRSGQLLEGTQFRLVPARPLKVTVRNEVGEPLEGASVHCIPHQAMLWSDGSMEPKYLAPITSLIVTEADGVALVPHRGADAYQLSVEHPDMKQRQVRGIDPELSEMVVVLSELDQFFGRVLDPLGQPVVGAQVGALFNRTTDADGWFKLPFREQPVLPPDHPIPFPWTFPVQAEGFASAVVVHPDPADRFPLVIQLEPEAVLEGRLIDAAGHGVADAFLRLERAPWAQPWTDYTLPDGRSGTIGAPPNWTEGLRSSVWWTTDDTGAFQLRGLAADLFRVRFYRDQHGPLLAVTEHRSDGGPITVCRGDGMQDYRVIRGRITNSATGEPLNKTRVFSDARGFAFHDAAAVNSDPDGSYALAGLSDGRANLTIYKPDFAQLQLKLDGTEPALHERDFALHPFCEARLRILDAEGVPAAGALVRIHDPQGGILRSVTAGGDRSLQSLDTLGEIDFQGAPGGAFLLRVMDLRRQLLGEFALDWTIPPVGVVELRLP